MPGDLPLGLTQAQLDAQLDNLDDDAPWRPPCRCEPELEGLKGHTEPTCPFFVED
jgi:hypothetical protein